ncbi:hypothetical protein N656DRAFT_780004 [Canariomyces notabilis]|uniref:DUF7707 domain-containing protein n=1 Tax=Canariomyces notabilis TaxID=2074819 RepID=A0AAN6TCK0_9PEZI|nr:hypothetical protein N656DRAFT_780004 [Canariomyces arenarius]
MRSIVLAVATALTTAVVAQNNGTYNVNPSTVDPGLRVEWCRAQFSTCGTLCAGSPSANDCNSNTLTYTCTCASNNSEPGLIYYTQTLPTFLCDRAYSDCVAANTSSARAQEQCKTDIKDHCGTLDPNKAQIDSGSSASESTTSAPASSSATGSPTAASGGAASTSSSRAGGPTNAAYIGNGVAVVAAGLFAALL